MMPATLCLQLPAFYWSQKNSPSSPPLGLTICMFHLRSFQLWIRLGSIGLLPGSKSVPQELERWSVAVPGWAGLRLF